MRLARTLGLAGIAVALWALPARAGEGDDAAAWLRKGKAAESIDHDPAKAIEHYRAALAAPGATEAGLGAGLRLLELLESSGDAKDALGTARELATRFTPVMDEPTKERVLDALGRLLPPGSKERTPLGLVMVPGPTAAAAEAEPSPLVRRFDDAFLLLSVNDPRSPDYARLRADLLDKLRPLGTDALPVLEWMIRSENLRKSTEAMSLLTAGFPTEGVPLLERLALDADVLVRGPALTALRKLSPSRPKGLALERLRKAPSLKAQASSLRKQLMGELHEAALLELHAEGGPEALDWLQAALQKGGEASLRRAFEVGARDRSAVRDWLVTLTAGGRYAGASTVARRDLEAFLRADPEAATSQDIRQGLATLAAAHVYDVPESDAAGRFAARREAWARIADMKSPEEAAAAMKALAIAQVEAPAVLFTDARWTEAFVSGWQLRALRDDEGSLGGIVDAEALGKAGPFWDQLAIRILAVPEKGRRLLELAVEAVGAVVPPDLVDARWVAIAARDLPTTGDVSLAGFLATAAAQSQDPSFVALYEKAARGDVGTAPAALTKALSAYRGADLFELLVRLLDRASFDARWQHLLMERARASMSPQQLLERVRGTREAHPHAAAGLVAVLREHRGAPEILTLLREEANRGGTLDGSYGGALVGLASWSRSNEAYPLLLRVYRETGSAAAAEAMDSIREYLQRVKTYEGWTRQAEDVGTEVEASLSSPDAAVRIAGVHAIVVLERRAAVGRLLKLIRTEKDATILDEANQMLRKLSKAILDGASPAPGAPDVHFYKELELGPGGKPPAPAAPTPPKDDPAPVK